MERIHKQDWEYTFVDERILGVEMRDGNKYYLAPNTGGVHLLIPHDTHSHCCAHVLLATEC